MPSDLSSFVRLGTMDCAYFLAFLIGVVWAIVILIAGDFGHSDAGDASAAMGHVDTFDTGSVAVSPISPIVISTFITSFGGAGIVSRVVFDVSGPVSLLYATLVGVALAGIMFLFYSKFLIASQGSSEVHVARLVGLTAEVTVSIPETGTGEIALVAGGSRVTYPARSSQRVAIQRGVLVTVDQMLGSIALVSPKPP